MSIENRKKWEKVEYFSCARFLVETGISWDVNINFREWFGLFWYKIAQEKLVLQNGTPR